MEAWAILHLRNRQRRLRRDKIKLYRRKLRDSLNPFELREIEFRNLFRLTRRLAMDLCETLFPHLEGQRRNHLPVHTQVLTAIRFFATGSYQRAVGQDFCLAVCQTSVGNCVRKISRLITQYLAAVWIKFPETFEERRHRKNQFLLATGVDGVIGCIDCTHIAISRPVENEAAYFNHHQFHSINVQIVCSYNLHILHIDPTMPGSVHDQFIFRYGTLRQALEQMHHDGIRNTWLLGDSGYVPEPYLLTPIRNAPLDSPEGRYTAWHCQTRNCVERLFGVMKSERRCLLKERVLKYTPPTAGRIIIACAVLNNMMRHYRVEEPHQLVAEAPLLHVEHNVIPPANAANVRAGIVHQYFDQ